MKEHRKGALRLQEARHWERERAGGGDALPAEGRDLGLPGYELSPSAPSVVGPFSHTQEGRRNVGHVYPTEFVFLCPP